MRVQRFRLDLLAHENNRGIVARFVAWPLHTCRVGVLDQPYTLDELCWSVGCEDVPYTAPGQQAEGCNYPCCAIGEHGNALDLSDWKVAPDGVDGNTGISCRHPKATGPISLCQLGMLHFEQRGLFLSRTKRIPIGFSSF